jgi:hypothetical protein
MAIRAGDVDGNPGAAFDPTWTPLLHTSGHGTFSSEAATVLAELSGSDEFQFVTTSDGFSPESSGAFAAFPMQRAKLV